MSNQEVAGVKKKRRTLKSIRLIREILGPSQSLDTVLYILRHVDRIDPRDGVDHQPRVS